jgi:hypothetical protein
MDRQIFIRVGQTLVDVAETSGVNLLHGVETVDVPVEVGNRVVDSVVRNVAYTVPAFEQKNGPPIAISDGRGRRLDAKHLETVRYGWTVARSAVKEPGDSAIVIVDANEFKDMKNRVWQVAFSDYLARPDKF